VPVPTRVQYPGCNWVNADPLTQEMLAMALLLPGGHLGGLGGNARQVGGSGEGVLTPRLLAQLQPGYCTLVGTSTSGPHRVCAGAAAGACACATGTQ
jgi:hypothetical protein